MYKFVCFVIILFLSVSCREGCNVIHMGENHSKRYNVEVDTMCINVGNSSGMGNFYFKDSIITFVDAINCTFYDLNLHGQLIESYFGKGHGDNEIRAIMYAFPIENDPLNRGVIVDNDYLITIFDRKNRRIIILQK